MPVPMPTVEQVDDLPSLMERRIPPEWQDLNGHVNVQHYLELYDAASWPMLAAFGLDERILLEQRHGLFDLVILQENGLSPVELLVQDSQLGLHAEVLQTLSCHQLVDLT